MELILKRPITLISEVLQRMSERDKKHNSVAEWR